MLFPDTRLDAGCLLGAGCQMLDAYWMLGAINSPQLIPSAPALLLGERISPFPDLPPADVPVKLSRSPDSLCHLFSPSSLPSFLTDT